MDQSEDIADIQRKLAALSGDNSASAMAKRRQLEAELAEAQQGLEDTYYDRSIENKQTALDNQLEFFTETREAEKEMWDKYLEDTEQVFQDSLKIIAESGETVKDTLKEVAEDWDLQINTHIKTPWNDATIALEETSVALNGIIANFEKAVKKADQTANTQVNDQKGQNKDITSAKENKSSNNGKSNDDKKDNNTVKYYKKYTGKSTSIVDALKAIGVDSSKSNRKKIAKVNGISNYSGTSKQNNKLLDLLKRGKLKKYAIGSKKIDEDQLAWLDELGEELQIVPSSNGRLDYVKKGTGIIPADMTERLMNLAMNPQDMLDRSRPTIGVSPEIHNTEINLNIQYGDMLKIENFKGDNPDEIAKIVAKQFEKHTAQLNQSLRKYVR